MLPGWASDWRIFSLLDLGFNYVKPLNFLPSTFADKLLEYIRKNNIKKVSLFGLSMGGFVAAEFAAKYPDLIDEIILVGIRKKYKLKELSEIRNHLTKNKKACLYEFYTMCFSDNKQLAWFQRSLFQDYCDKWDLDYLFQGLDYLENAEIRPESLVKLKKIQFVHGENDQIAPIAEAKEIKRGLPQAKFISIKGAGHIHSLRGGLLKV